MMSLEHLIVFHLLKYCWEKYDVNDDLPALLGEMSPYLWSDRIPMDKAVYNDWDKICQNVNDNMDWIEKLIQLLMLFEDSYHFDFSETKKALSHFGNNEVSQIIDYCKNNSINLSKTES